MKYQIPHTPILVDELISLFSEDSPPQKMLDCTFGRGGHSLAFLKAFPQLCITALDCDESAVAYGRSLKEVKEGKIKIFKQNFHHLSESGGILSSDYDLILMDLGVSSPQLDEEERGFSFYRDGPLDMRMDREKEFQAKDIINAWNKKDLIQFFQSYGEIRKPHKVVEALLKQRQKKHFERTRELSQLIQKASGFQRGNRHPATKWFLALRMKVNEELEGLKNSLSDFVPLLKEGAYLAVISFHSLEDRIVKEKFRNWSKEEKGRLWNKKVIRPSFQELKKNIRSRSAKLRVFQKLRKTSPT